MQHLDEGILSALLDGELTGNEQREAEAHLRTCAECSARLEELRSLMLDASLLVDALGEPGANELTHPPATTTSGMKYRVWAWAASILLVVGLGFAGSSIFLTRDASRQNVATSSPAIGEKESSSSAALKEADQRTAVPESGTVGSLANRHASSPAPEAPRVLTTPVPTAAPPNQDTAPALAAGQRSQLAHNALSIRGGRSDQPTTYVDGVSPAAGYRGSGFAQTDSAAAGGRLRARAESTIALGNASAALGRLSPADKALETQSGSAERASADGNPLSPRNQVAARPDEQSPFRKVSMEEAVRQLGGTIRLIDGLAPNHIEAKGSAGPPSGAVVRVVYLIDGKALFLDQQRVDSTQTNPPYLGQLQRERAETDEEQNGKSLDWNDIEGFHLSLSGPFSGDLLRQLKLRVK
jgi:hypothetical protein